MIEAASCSIGVFMVLIIQGDAKTPIRVITSPPAIASAIEV